MINKCFKLVTLYLSTKDYKRQSLTLKDYERNWWSHLLSLWWKNGEYTTKKPLRLVLGLQSIRGAEFEISSKVDHYPEVPFPWCQSFNFTTSRNTNLLQIDSNNSGCLICLSHWIDTSIGSVLCIVLLPVLGLFIIPFFLNEVHLWGFKLGNQSFYMRVYPEYILRVVVLSFGK